MHDTQTRQHSRPEEAWTATDAAAYAAACACHDFMLERFPLDHNPPTFTETYHWVQARYRKRVELEELSPDEATAQGNGLAACLMCMCVFGGIGVLAVAALVNVLTGK